MTNTRNRMTGLELVLYIWTALNTAIGAWVLLTSQLTIYGPHFLAWIPLAIGLPAAAYLLWRMLKPSLAILLFGTLYWALQTFSVQLPNALYKFRLGLSVDFRLTDNPKFVVAINLLAIVVTGLFAYAASNRSATVDQVSAERT